MSKELPKLYKFCWDFGRQGSLEGIFSQLPSIVKEAIGKEVYFGEVLGKHSEVHGSLDDGDLSELTDDQDFIRKATGFGLIPSGHNPFEYMEEE